jgi:mannosyltransferase
MTAIAVLPVAAVWLVSQGPYSYFFPRYLLLTVGAWAILAGIALSRLDLKMAMAGLAVIVYQSQAGAQRWLMIGYGLEYYLARDLPPGTPAPRQLFIAETGAQAGGLYPLPCQPPAACLGAEPRIWIVASGSPRSPYDAVTRAQATLLRPHYRLALVEHAPSLTVFLLVRDA